MNTLKLCFLPVFMSFFCGSALAQESFSNCAVAFLDGEMIVSEYSPSGTSVLSHDATGNLSVYTAQLTESGATPVDPISFYVAMRDADTGTLLMLTSEPNSSFDLSELLLSCESGDHLVLITAEAGISLPHNEILLD